MEQQRVTVTGCTVSLRRGGAGQPMLYLHGAGGAPEELPFMTALAGDFDLLVPEHPGYGASDDPEWLDNIHDLAFFYLDFIKHLGLEGVHLAGSSMGGWIALEMAVRNTSAIRTLTLSAPAGIHLKGVPKGDLFMWSPEETLRNLLHDPQLAENAIAAMPEGLETDPIFLKNRSTAAKLLWSPRLYNPHLYKWLHRIDIPTLIMWGREDKLLPVAYAEAFAKLIPGAETAILDQCGHLPYLEQADRFVELLRGHVARETAAREKAGAGTMETP